MRTARYSMITACAAALLALSTGSPAMDHSAMGHDMSGTMTAGAGTHNGAMIRQASVGGYALMYHLLNWQERNAAMKGMEGMEMAGMDNSGKSTNHLMVYISTAAGKEVSGAKVGFQVTRPDGADQKTLTMAMGGGYGADVIMKDKGLYKIMCKFVVGGTTTVDEFTYQVK